jgi:DNA-binding NtrC family response regulator
MKKRVLLIDDDRMVLDVTRAMLERHGFEVAVEIDSIRAVDTFYKDPSDFDVVVTDQAMPDITGLGLSNLFFKIRSDIPIVLITGITGGFDTAAAGVCRVVRKPLLRAELVEAIEEALERKEEGEFHFKVDTE